MSVQIMPLVPKMALIQVSGTWSAFKIYIYVSFKQNLGERLRAAWPSCLLSYQIIFCWSFFFFFFFFFLGGGGGGGGGGGWGVTLSHVVIAQKLTLFGMYHVYSFCVYFYTKSQFSLTCIKIT